MSDLDEEHARVRCLTVTHLNAETSGSTVLLRSTDPLYSGFAHQEFVHVKDAASDILWLVRLPGSVEQAAEQLEDDDAATRCLSYCRRCERKRRVAVRRQGDPYPFRAVRYVIFFLLLSTGALSSVFFLQFANESAPDGTGIFYRFVAIVRWGFLVLVGTSAMLCGLMLLLVCIKNLSSYFRRERRYHLITPKELPWTATTTRCLADGNRVRHGWTDDGWDVIGDWTHATE